ncbi:hypothetical protein ACL02R_07740 [Streptomyces sp. MS19]|uniref:hypothetical protein n=1 Tax=Streptomyces sp. MS19 TaxID=3385972 RepID=UPI0039A107E5
MTGENAGAEPSWSVGLCWLWCGHRNTLVTWIGTVSTGTPAVAAPLYACGPCLETLQGAVEDHAHASAHLPVDEEGRDVPLYVTPGLSSPRAVRARPGGRHRRPRTTLGRRWQRLIDGDDPEPFISTTEKRGVRQMPYRERSSSLAVAAAVGAALGVAAVGAPRGRTRKGLRRLVRLVDESWFCFYQGVLIWLDEDPAGARDPHGKPPPAGIRVVPEEELVRRIFAPDNAAGAEPRTD